MKLTTITKRYVYEKVLVESTVQTYLKRTRRFDDEVKYRTIYKLKQDKVLLWRDSLIERGVRPASINNYMRHCRTIWKYAFKKQIVEDPHVFDIPRMPETRLDKTVSDQSMKIAQAVLESGGIDNSWFWATVFYLQKQTGIRNRQLLNLKAGDINFENLTLYCSAKGNKTRQENTLPINADTLDQIKVYLKNSNRVLGRELIRTEYLFEIARYDPKYKKHRTGMTSDQLQKMYRDVSNYVSEITGERITGHRLRHSLATKIGSQPDINLRVIQEFFGWSCIQTAQNYIKVDVDAKRKLLEYI